MRLLTIVAVTLTVAVSCGAASAQTTDLLFSEYVEGSANNKALEIFNGTEDVINLGDYTIERYNNGATTSYSIALNSVDLGPGEIFVICHPLADPTLLAKANQTNTNLNFNGNDAVVLAFSGGVVIDSIGRVGEDPVTAWSCAGGSTANHTLRRLSSVCAGDTVPGDGFDPCEQWAFAPSDVFSGLGAHIADCGAVANEATSWGGLKAEFR